MRSSRPIEKPATRRLCGLPFAMLSPHRAGPTRPLTPLGRADSSQIEWLNLEWRTPLSEFCYAVCKPQSAERIQVILAPFRDGKPAGRAKY